MDPEHLRGRPGSVHRVAGGWFGMDGAGGMSVMWESGQEAAWQGLGQISQLPMWRPHPGTRRDLIWKQGLCSCDHLWHLPSSPSRFWAQCAGPWLRLDISPSGAQLQTRRGRLQDSTVLRAPGDETLRSRRGLGPKHDIAKEQLSKTLALWSSVFSSAEDSLSSRRRWSLTHSLHDESENSATK